MLITHLKQSGSARQILDLVAKQHAHFNQIHAVTALHTLARLSPAARRGYAAHPGWPQLLQTLRRQIPLFEANKFGGTLWACNKLQLKDGPMLPQLLSGASELLTNQPGVWQMPQLTACLVGLAGLQLEGDAAFLSAPEQRLLRLPTAEARGISSCVWSFAKRQHVLGPSVVDAVARRFSEVVQQANPQDVANLLYGLASMGAAPSRQLLDSCTERLVDTLQLATAQHVANTLWALGELGHCPPDSTMQDLPAGRRSTGAIWLRCLIGALAAR